MSHAISIALSVFVVGLLAGGCNQQLSPPASNTGGPTPTGGSGAGGSSGTGGSSTGGSNACASTDQGVCVATCFRQNPVRIPSGCADNVPTCPDGFVPLTTCPEKSCVWSRSCCDEATGALTDPVCGDDGMLICPAASHIADGECIPSSLRISTCNNLDSQPCDQRDQQCSSATYRCVCGRFEPADAAATWSCYDLPIIP